MKKFLLNNLILFLLIGGCRSNKEFKITGDEIVGKWRLIKKPVVNDSNILKFNIKHLSSGSEMIFHENGFVMLNKVPSIDFRKNNDLQINEGLYKWDINGDRIDITSTQNNIALAFEVSPDNENNLQLYFIYDLDGPQEDCSYIYQKIKK